MGAPTACENAGVPDVSYNGSTVDACPNTFIVASKINWTPYFKYAAEKVQNGEAIDVNWTGGFDTGSVELTDINEKAAAAGTQEKLDEVEAGLKDGSIQVFDTSTFTVDGKELTQAYALDTDGDFVPDSEEAVYDGAFHESVFQSAPYFGMIIDGITLLDSGN
jgi:basic membrane protein A